MVPRNSRSYRPCYLSAVSSLVSSTAVSLRPLPHKGKGVWRFVLNPAASSCRTRTAQNERDQKNKKLDWVRIYHIDFRYDIQSKAYHNFVPHIKMHDKCTWYIPTRYASAAGADSFRTCSRCSIYDYIPGIYIEQYASSYLTPTPQFNKWLTACACAPHKSKP